MQTRALKLADLLEQPHPPPEAVFNEFRNLQQAFSIWCSDNNIDPKTVGWFNYSGAERVN
jgi:hypothetical protein